jgi:hypothetical protein
MSIREWDLEATNNSMLEERLTLFYLLRNHLNKRPYHLTRSTSRSMPHLVHLSLLICSRETSSCRDTAEFKTVGDTAEFKTVERLEGSVLDLCLKT